MLLPSNAQHNEVLPNMWRQCAATTLLCSLAVHSPTVQLAVHSPELHTYSFHPLKYRCLPYIHHASGCRWGNRAIQVWLPEEMQVTLHMLMEGGHRRLAAEGTNTLFVSTTGLPFTSSNYCAYWQAMMSAGEAAAVCPPRMLRHVFADERLSANAAPGPSNESAAMVMGE